MADRLLPAIFTFQGGFATDLAPQVRELTFLTKAENLLYEVSGAVRKVGGAAKINSTAMSGGPSVLGMFDFWLSGTTGTSTQKFVAVTSDGKVYKEDMDGTFDDITGAASISPNAIPVFCQARDLLTIWFSTNDTPLKWNQTGNVASLGGSPPAGRGCVFHVNRGWAFGRNSNPSRLYYSSSTDIEDWSGADTGSIDIDPEDGDRIIGAVSYKKNLIVFKGPNKGSIHIISGTAPTGSDAFSRTLFVKGIALQTHNSIVEVGDDVWFMSDQGIHSLAATDQFGNFVQAMLTRFLTGFFRNDINRSRLASVWGVNYAHKGAVLWAMTASGNTVNALSFGLSYIRSQEDGIKAFTWPGRSCQSATIRINPATNLRELVFSDNAGFVRRQDTTDRSIDGTTAYNMRVTTPQIILGKVDSAGTPKADQPVTLHDLYLRSRPKGNFNVSVSITRDEKPAQAYTINQGSIGSLFGTGVFGTATWGGGALQTAYVDGPGLSGECRSVRIDIQQGGLNEDADIYEMGILSSPSSQSREATL